jgi:hypothetical protein
MNIEADIAFIEWQILIRPALSHPETGFNQSYRFIIASIDYALKFYCALFYHAFDEIYLTLGHVLAAMKMVQLSLSSAGHFHFPESGTVSEVSFDRNICFSYQ